jgi:3-hydroxyacyl-[acyl-carrier-protein] dehydratase
VASEAEVTAERIKDMLPHRYPFLLVDRVQEWEARHRIVAIKNVTQNEPFFQGHFPDYAIMPGVLLVEALVQTGGLLAKLSEPEAENKGVYFTGIDNCRFRRPVTPGDQLVLEATVAKQKSPFWHFQTEARVDGERVADAYLKATIAD